MFRSFIYPRYQKLQVKGVHLNRSLGNQFPNNPFSFQLFYFAGFSVLFCGAHVLSITNVRSALQTLRRRIFLVIGENLPNIVTLSTLGFS